MLSRISERMENLEKIEFLIQGIGRKARTGYFTRQEELDAEEIKDIISIKNSLWESMVTPIPMFPTSDVCGGEIIASPAKVQAYIETLKYEKALKSQYQMQYGHKFDFNHED